MSRIGGAASTTIGLATTAKQDEVIDELEVINSLVPTKYDYISLSYTGSNLTGVVFKNGGSAGSTASTLTLAYDGSNNLTSVTKTQEDIKISFKFNPFTGKLDIVETDLNIKVAVDANATADYLGATAGVGSLRADDTTIGKTDGGDFITLGVKTDGINDTHIDWGTGANQVSAVDVPIADAGTYFTTDNVEAALQALALPPTKTVQISPGFTDNNSTLQYSTIQAALTANATTGTMFVVYPGTYTNDTIIFTANNQYVVGAHNVAPKVALVTNSITICNYGAFTGCVVKDIKMIMTLATTVADSTIDGDSGGSCNFKHCHIECNAVAGTIDGTVPGGSTAIRGDGTVKIVDGSIVYDNDATRGARGKKAILIEAGSDLTIDKVKITVTASGTSSATAAIRDNSDGTLLIENSTVDVTDDDATITYGLNIDNGSGEPEVYKNIVHVTNDGADKTVIAVRIGNTGSTLGVRSMYNHFHAVAGGTGTTYAYCLQIDDDRTTAISQFDDLVCANGVNIIAGTYTKVNSPIDGNLEASGSITGETLVSNIADGTAPLTVASTTVVSNLNADQVDGLDSTDLVLQSLADAADDFIVASGDNVWVRKTLAETGAILEGDIDHGNIQGLSTGADHSYISQDVTTTGTPTFATTLFTDKIKLTQTDGNEYIDSLADNYLDLGATTAIRNKAVTIFEDAIYFTQVDGNEYIDSLTDGYLDLGATTATRVNGPLQVIGASGDLNITSAFDGGDYNIFSTTGNQTLAIYGSGANVLNVDLLDGNLAFSGAGSIGVTGARVLKGWFDDLEVTNAIAGSITGNAATVTGFTPASGSLTLAGADALTITTTAGTGVTLPTSGTLLANVVEDTAPQIGGDLDLNDKNITLKMEPGSDELSSGLIVTMTVDTNAEGIGAPLFIAADGNLDTADADTSATAPCVALALEAGTGSKKVLLHGVMRVDAWNWTTGPGKASLIYLSTTVGTLTQTQPSGTDEVVQAVGYALSDDVMFFNPSMMYFTHT